MNNDLNINLPEAIVNFLDTQDADMETKKCLACKEDILINAKKCKHCLQIQNPIANLQNNPYFSYGSLVIVLVTILWITIVMIFHTTDDPIKPEFEVKPANLLISESDKGLNIRCIADIKNPYAKRWTDFSLQAKFKNTAGETIDVLYSKPKLTIYPLFEFTAIVSGIANTSKEEYNSCEITVIDADY
jgi:hypothetical protein